MALYRQHLEVHPERPGHAPASGEPARGRRAGCAEAYKEAGIVRRAQPDDPEAIGVEADLALRLGHAARADELLDQLDRGRPRRPGTRGAGGRDPGRSGGAGARPWRGPRAGPRATPPTTRGALLMAGARSEAGDTAGAVAAARRAVEMAPDSLAPRFALGGLLQTWGRYAAAESVWAVLARGGPAAGARGASAGLLPRAAGRPGRRRERGARRARAPARQQRRRSTSSATSSPTTIATWPRPRT